MSKPSSILANFHTPQAILKAAKATYKAGYREFETHTPFPIHGMDDAMGLRASKLPWIVLCCGATGLTVGLSLQTWVATVAYKLVISGKPLFSYQAFIPVIFEIMVLFSAFGTVFGMFYLNGLPKWYKGLFKSKQFATASSHGFFLEILAKDANFELEKTTQFLTSIGATDIEEIRE